MKLIEWPYYGADFLLSQGLSPDFVSRFWEQVIISGEAGGAFGGAAYRPIYSGASEPCASRMVRKGNYQRSLSPVISVLIWAFQVEAFLA